MTLIELLVVISLLLVLMTLAILFVPSINEQQRAARGATQLQQWLLTAKQRALRDQAPRGVRLYVDPAKNFVTEMRYIEEPEPFRRGTVRATAANPTQVLFRFAAGEPNLTDGFGTGAAAADLRPVQVGDYLEVRGVGTAHRITAVAGGNVTLASPVTAINPATGQHYALPETSEYRIIRAPRVMGEDALQMPSEVVIDINTNMPAPTGFNNPLRIVNNTIDILFAPSGRVIGWAPGNETICLWVRDTTLPLREGDNTIVAVHVRSGAIAAHPVPRTGSPYAFTSDGRASGL
jgi:type II secretory pathway pseudopilin PulG